MAVNGWPKISGNDITWGIEPLHNMNVRKTAKRLFQDTKRTSLN